MRILGIDPGLKTIGIGLIDVPPGSRTPTVIEWLTIETETGSPLAMRLAEISTDIAMYIDEAKPELVVVEKLFFETNRRTAMDVAQARGAIVSEIGKRMIPMLEPTPLELKHAVTGDGSADKRQVKDMVVRVLSLTEMPTPDDAADALALALYGCFCGSPLVSAR